MSLIDFFQHNLHPTWQDTMPSQIEISFWQFLPGLLMIVFMLGGFSKLLFTKRSRRDFRQKQRSSRAQMALPMIINTPVTQEFSVSTYDISLTGAFLSYDDLKNSTTFTSLVGKRSGIKVGDLVDIKVFTGRFSQFKCQARVVRYNFSKTSPPPRGVGIEFVNLSGRKKKILENLIYSKGQQQVA